MTHWKARDTWLKNETNSPVAATVRRDLRAGLAAVAAVAARSRAARFAASASMASSTLITRMFRACVASSPTVG